MGVGAGHWRHMVENRAGGCGEETGNQGENTGQRQMEKRILVKN